MKKLLLLVIVAVLSACSSEPKFTKNPVDVKITKLRADKNVKTFTIILEDMEMESNTFSADVFKHKYTTLIEYKDDTIVDTKIGDWERVPKTYFWKRENDLGMEVASMDSTGTLSKVAAPAGYSNYVGNSRYGYWNGGFWSWYGRYAMFSTMFHMMSPTPYGYYGSYRSSYRGSRPYYGPSTTNSSGGKSTAYGTTSKSMRSQKPGFFSRRASNSSWSKSSSSPYNRKSGVGSSRYGGRSRSGGGGFGK